MIKMLTNLSTLEISNVKKAANRKRYAITKSETAMDIKQVVTVVAEGEAEFVETLKSEGASAERIEAETALYRIQKNCADVLKPVEKKAHEEPDKDDEEQMDGESDEAYKARAKKSGFEPKKKAAKADNQTGIDPNFKPAHKSAEEAVMDEKVEALFKCMNEKLAAVEKINQELVAKNERLEYVAKAEREFAHAPGSAEEIATVLKSAHDAGPEAEKTIVEQLKRMNDFVAKNETIMQSMGVAGQPAGNGDAMAKIEALASGLTMKAESGKEMTKEQKISYVISKTAEGRDLYAQYMTEHPKQRA